MVAKLDEWGSESTALEKEARIWDLAFSMMDNPEGHVPDLKNRIALGKEKMADMQAECCVCGLYRL